MGAEVEAVEVELHNELIVQYLDIIKQLKHLEEDMSEQMVCFDKNPSGLCLDINTF